jgi:hypothetical protein
MSANGAAALETVLLEELLRLVEPLREAADSALALQELLADMGWDADAIGLATSMISGVEQAATAIEGIVDTGGEPTFDTLVSALEATASLVGAIQDLSQVGSSAPPEWGQVGETLVELLVTRWLSSYHPLVYRIAKLLTFIRPAHEVPDTNVPDFVDTGTALARYPVAGDQLRLDQIGKLLTDPVGTLKAEYLPTGVTGQAYADGIADLLLPKAGSVIQAIGAQALYSTDTVDGGGDLGATGATIASHALTIWVPFGSDGIGTTVALLPHTPSGIDVAVAPFGTLTYSDQVGGWQLDLTATVGIDAITFGPAGVALTGIGGSFDGSGRLTRLASGGNPVLLIGNPSATRLEVGAFAVELDVAFDTSGTYDVGILAVAQHALVAVAGGDGDGFLDKILPSPGITVPFDLGVGFSRSRGLYFKGGATLEIDVPLNITLFDVLTINDVDLLLGPQGAGVRIEASATAEVDIGPFSATVEKIGLRADIAFPPGGAGNLGPFDLTLGFKPPTGAGLSLDAGVISGGGFLSFNDPEYAGILQLSALDELTLTAIGLISTKMPSGARGFSLLLIITAEFPPIQLGYGFTLNGVGGLVGANRTMNPDELRTQLHSGGLESILFPPDPVAHAEEVIANLRTAFPVAEGRFVLGPMAKLGWGASIISLELGLMFELPPPFKIALLGRLAISLPDGDTAEILLQLDVLGLLDFGTGDISFDATLHDSHIVDFPITGDMALRANVGSHPAFALAAGGFHPAFTPPPDFPQMQRLGISLGDGDNPRIRLEAYMALTTNTVQTGAHVDIYAYVDAGLVGTFSVSAQLGFDAILHLSPFSFQADFGASVDFKHNGDSIAAVDLELHLTAPNPWHAWGKAMIHFLGTHEFDTSLTVGSTPPPPPPAPVNVLTDHLLPDLALPASWAAQLPDDAHLLVTLRDPGAGDVVLLHPLGSLSVHERSVPFGLTLKRFGTAPVSGPTQFELTSATVNGQSQSTSPLTDRFAPAQFLALSDDDALRSPAFEEMTAGATIEIAGSGQATGREGDLVYDTVAIDQTPLPPLGSYQPTAEKVGVLTGVGAAARSGIRVPGAKALAGPGAAMTNGGWAIAHTKDLTPPPSGHGLDVPAGTSHAQASQTLANHLASTPGESGAWQVVERHEVAA